MSEEYNPRIIENKWQDFWKNNKTFKSAVNKNKSITFWRCSLTHLKIHMGSPELYLG